MSANLTFRIHIFPYNVLSNYLPQQSPIPPQFVSWKHNDRLLNYDKYRGGVVIQTEHGPKTTSHLLISGATVVDSGNYTCGAPNTEAATVHVFVSQGT